MGIIVNIKEKFFGRKEIFKNFEYSFSDTGLYIISGPSGCGKTTFLRILSGLDKDFKGTVTGGGAANVSFHFQEYRLFNNLTVLENITEISFKNRSSDDEEKAIAYLKRLGFKDEELYLLPSELSGGMKMRVSFARALLKNAPVLLLDEPTKELDFDTASIVNDMIIERSKTSLVIMVTHTQDLSLYKDAVIINL